MYDSLRTLLGPDGFKALLREMSTNYQARLAAEDEQQQQQPELPPRLRAPFLATLERLYPDPGNANGWGFVVYRLAAHGDERLWAALRERWDGIVRERLRNYEGVPGVAEAVQQIEFRWIEYGELEGATLGTVAKYVRVFAFFVPFPHGHEALRTSVTPLKVVREIVTIAVSLPNKHPFPPA